MSNTVFYTFGKIFAIMQLLIIKLSGMVNSIDPDQTATEGIRNFMTYRNKKENIWD